MKKYVLVIISLIFVTSANAQFVKKLGKKAQKAAERSVEKKVEEKTEQKTEQVLDSIFDASPDKSDKKSKNVNKDVEATSGENNNSANNTQQDKGALVTGSTFFPDGNVLFFEDFEEDALGDFPVNWETNSGGELIMANNTKALRFYPNGIYIAATDKLPENYALEFDLITKNLNYKGLSGSGFFLEFVTEHSFTKSLNTGAKVGFSLWQGSDLPNRFIIENWGKGVSKIQNNIDFRMSENLNTTVHFTMVINGKRLRVYVNNEKAVDVPSLLQADAGRFVRFYLKGTDKTKDHIIAISDIKITEEDEDIRSMLLKGGFSTTKILFNSGSDELKPESYAFMEKLGKTLQNDSSLRIMIIGHTDSDGDAVKNMTLSKSRAFVVANYLIDRMGIDKKRLLAQGRGENEPIANNNSLEGRAQNRRVEFKKM